MGKDLQGKELGRGIHQRPDGRYEGRATVNGVKIDICNSSLTKLRKAFEKEKAKVLRYEKNIRPNETLVSWYTEWFWRSKAPQLKSETNAKIYDRKVRNTYVRILGDKLIEFISQINIQDATNQLIEEGYVERTVSEALSTLKQCLDAAVVNHLILVNPCIGIVVKDNRPTEERRILDHWEQDLFIEQIKYTAYYEPYMILLLTGMRIGEFAGLQWQDIDFANKQITIRRSLSTTYIDGKKEEFLTTPKTVSGNRNIPFFANVEELLLDWRDKQQETKDRLNGRWRVPPEFGDLVFTTTLGSPLTRYALASTTKKVVENMRAVEKHNAVIEGREPRDIKSLYPHAFRHTFATRCFEQGMDSLFVQRIMGHANYSTTLSYTHILDNKTKFEVAKGFDLLGINKPALLNEENSDDINNQKMGRIKFEAKIS